MNVTSRGLTLFNGNISEYLTAAGTIAAHFEYELFGNPVVNTDTANLFAYRFSTKPRDKETGLYYYGYRYYDPMTGRWPSRHPQQKKDLISTTLDARQYSTTVDGQFRDSVRAKMRILIRQLLRKYKYPPEGQEAAIALVLAQAQALADDWMG